MKRLISSLLLVLAALLGCDDSNTTIVSGSSNNGAEDGVLSDGNGGSLFITSKFGTSESVTPESGSSKQQRSKVLNGAEQPEEASPQMVRLEIADALGSIALCSGVVIAPERVLTAGHCISNSAKQITVSTQGADFAASRFILAPGYFESLEPRAIFNDAAVLTVPGLAAPALPLIVGAPVSETSDLLVFGFGLDESGSTGTLKFGNTSATLVTPNHVFGEEFTGGNIDPCFGDSGGPLVASLVQPDGSVATGVVGIVSSGTASIVENDVTTCGRGDVTLYTNLQNPALVDFLVSAAPGIVIR